jgi:integrase
LASITKQPNGRWKVRYWTPDGLAQRSKTFDRKVDAERFAARTETEKTQGDWVDPRRGQVTLGEWVEQWWPTIVNLSASTKATRRAILDHHVLPKFGRVQLGRITHTSVATWIAELEASGLSPGTVVKCHQVLSRVLAGAVDAGMLSRNVTTKVGLPRVRMQEMRFLTCEQVAGLAKVHPERYRALVLVAAYGGLRFGELAGLRRRRVDLAGRVRIEETCVEVAGELHWGAPKTDAGRRTVALPGFVAQALREHQGKWSQPGPQGVVFTGPDGGPLRRSNYRSRVWLPCLRQAGLEGLRFHDLRHTAVALWIKAGANVLEVKRRAGHTRSTFTLDRYGHLFPDADEGLADRLDSMFANGEPSDSATVRSLPS